jgi:hypothetical protein
VNSELHSTNFNYNILVYLSQKNLPRGLFSG